MSVLMFGHSAADSCDDDNDKVQHLSVEDMESRLDKKLSLAQCLVLREYTPLAYAIFAADLDLFHKLLKEGVDLDVDGAAKDGLSPLHYCCENNMIDEAKALLEHKADVNARTNDRQVWTGVYSSGGLTPLHLAAGAGNKDVIKLLLEHKADPAAKDLCGDTAFTYACLQNYPSAAKVIDASQPALDAAAVAQRKKQRNTVVGKRMRARTEEKKRQLRLELAELTAAFRKHTP